MPHEDLRHVFADGVMKNDYADPSFWLSGGYAEYKTATVQFLTIGPNYIKWMWELTKHDSKELAYELGATLSIPAQPTRRNLYEHAGDRPREIYGMRGTIRAAMSLPVEDPRRFTEETRQDMVVFAFECPFLLDWIRYEAMEDFTLWHAKDSSELRMYHQMPGKRFMTWQHDFPELLPDIYWGIHRRHGKVIEYNIYPPSDEFLTLRELSR